MTKMQQTSLGSNSGINYSEEKIKDKLEILEKEVKVKRESLSEVRIKQEPLEGQEVIGRNGELNHREYNNIEHSLFRNRKVNNDLTIVEKHQDNTDFLSLLGQYPAMQHPAYRAAVGAGPTNSFGFPHFYAPMLPPFPPNIFHDQAIHSPDREKHVNEVRDQNNESNENRIKMETGYHHRQSNSNHTNDFNDTLLRDYRTHHDFHHGKLPGYPAVSSAAPAFRSSLEMAYFNQHQQQQQQNLQQQHQNLQQQANQLNNIRRLYQGKQKKWNNSTLRSLQPSVSLEK